MLILCVHNLSPWDSRSGGGQKAHHEIALALNERGHEVRGLFLGEAPDPPNSTVPYPIDWVPEHPRLLNNVMAFRRATKRLLKKWTPDAVYLSSAESAGVLFGLPPGMPVIMTSHHYELPHLLSSTAWLSPIRALRKLRMLQRFYLERLVMQRAKSLTAVSDYGRQILLDRGYVEPSTLIQVIPNGVHDFWFEKDKAIGARQPRKDQFLFVGRMDSQKGVDVLLRAMASFNIAWPLDLIGDGWQRQEYEDLSRKLGLEAHVTFLGHGSPEFIRHHMRNAGALVVPSRAENYPLVLLEAMATETPVLSTTVGGIPEMIHHGKNGILVAPDNETSLGEGLTTIADDSNLRGAISREGLIVAKRHRWSEVAKRIESEIAAAAST